MLFLGDSPCCMMECCVCCSWHCYGDRQECVTLLVILQSPPPPPSPHNLTLHNLTHHNLTLQPLVTCIYTVYTCMSIVHVHHWLWIINTDGHHTVMGIFLADERCNNGDRLLPGTACLSGPDMLDPHCLALSCCVKCTGIYTYQTLTNLLPYSSTHPLAGGEAGGHEVKSETSSVVFRDRPSVKSLANRFERNNRRKSSIFSSTSARKKWRDFEKKVRISLIFVLSFL